MTELKVTTESLKAARGRFIDSVREDGDLTKTRAINAMNAFTNALFVPREAGEGWVEAYVDTQFTKDKYVLTYWPSQLKWGLHKDGKIVAYTTSYRKVPTEAQAWADEIIKEGEAANGDCPPCSVCGRPYSQCRYECKPKPPLCKEYWNREKIYRCSLPTGHLGAHKYQLAANGDCSRFRMPNANAEIEKLGAAEKKYPCIKCGKKRTKAEGGTTFTLCEDCFEEKYSGPTPIGPGSRFRLHGDMVRIIQNRIGDCPYGILKDDMTCHEWYANIDDLRQALEAAGAVRRWDRRSDA